MLQTFLNYIVELVESLGYAGILIATFIEGTFIPIPSEMTLIPAGYLAAQGEFNLYLVILFSVVGTLSGALFSYFLAYRYGEILLLNAGKYFFFTEEKLSHIKRFFASHGPLSAFIGRILPGIKHFISFPAGLAKMRFSLFATYSALGGALWCTVLIITGYALQHTQDELSHHIAWIERGLLFITLLILIAYCVRFYFRKKTK